MPSSPPAVAAHCSAVCSPLVLLCGSADMPLLSHGQLSRLDDTTASCPRLGIKALFITWCLQYQPIQMDGQLCSSSVAAKSAAARPAPAAAICSAVVRCSSGRTRSLPIPWWDVMKHGQRSGAMRAAFWQVGGRRALRQPTCLPASSPHPRAVLSDPKYERYRF